MNPVVNRRPEARRDLVDVFDYYVDAASIRTARRFLAQTEATFQRLARMPSIGTLVDPDHPTRPALRYMRISRFRNYAVFYLPIPGGIDVIRVLHGARDLENILDAEFE